MKREIKFKAWDGSRVRLWSNIVSTIGFHHWIIEKCDGVEIMQFTGLRDKNGVEIYEDDIVRILYTDWMSKLDSDKRKLEEYLKDIAHIGVVSFHNYGWFVKIKDHYSYIIHGKHGYIEVIGNIHENPELLK